MVEEMKSKRLGLDVKHYTTLINGYCLQGDLVTAFNMFKEMKEKGLYIDRVT